MSLQHFSYLFQFKNVAKTSRGTLKNRQGWFIYDEELISEQEVFIGEVCTIPGLSLDQEEQIETKIRWLIDQKPTKEEIQETLSDFPAVRFAWEMLEQNRQFGKTFEFVENEFTKQKIGIPINGLIWMGDFLPMWRQLLQKKEDGFRCIKIKIGALDFQLEFDFLWKARYEFLEIAPEFRLDANGAFSPKDAMRKLEQLSTLKIHSLEQPIQPGQWKVMRLLCKNSPIPIALDEELIGIHTKAEKAELLDFIQPQAIVLKPSLLGGFFSCEEWIYLAEERNIQWWITSALESSIGLNAIAQWTAQLLFEKRGFYFTELTIQNDQKWQGLGTGEIYLNNFPSPLQMKNALLTYRKKNNQNILDFIHLQK